MITGLFVVELTLTTPALTADRYGAQKRSYAVDDGATVETVFGWLNQTQSKQDDEVTTDAKAFLPAGTAVDVHTRVASDDAQWLIVGVPHHARTKSGAVNHIEVQLRAVSS